MNDGGVRSPQKKNGERMSDVKRQDSHDDKENRHANVTKMANQVIHIPRER